jgi:hypothetical protein
MDSNKDVDIDLNINNYTFSEMLNVFKFHEIDDILFHFQNAQIKMKNLLLLVEENFSQDVLEFYTKIYKIILTICTLCEIPNMLDKNDELSINYYIEKIKQVRNFQKKDIEEILTDPSFTNEYDNSEYHSFREDTSKHKKQNTVINKTIDKYKKVETDTNKIISPSYLEQAQTTVLNSEYDSASLGYQDRVSQNPALHNANHTNYIANSYNNAVAPSQLNSLKRVVHLQNIHLNTLFRQNYNESTSSNFTYQLPVELKNVVSMRLSSIEIANCIYLFSNAKKNNRCKIIVTVGNVSEEYEIYIDEGNYDYCTLANYLNTNYFYQAQPGTPYYGSNLQYIVFTINQYNFRTFFYIQQTPTTPADMKFSVLFVYPETVNNNAMDTLGWILGFRSYQYLNININEELVSEGLFNGGGDEYIYFCLNDNQYNKNNENVAALQNSIIQEDILAKIPMINGKLSLVVDYIGRIAKLRRYNGPVTLNRIQVKLLDQFGNIINLNNMNFSFTLEVEMLYESFNFKDVYA